MTDYVSIAVLVVLLVMFMALIMGDVLGDVFKGCSSGVHKFEAVYDHGKVPPFSTKGENSVAAITAIMEASRPRTYVAHVCTRCGKKVRRDG